VLLIYINCVYFLEKKFKQIFHRPPFTIIFVIKKFKTKVINNQERRIRFYLLFLTLTVHVRRLQIYKKNLVSSEKKKKKTKTKFSTYAYIKILYGIHSFLKNKGQIQTL